MDSDKLTISKNRFRKNYQNFEKINFSHRTRYYNSVLPHWHNFYELELVIGSGTTTINDTTFSFEHAALCLLNPTNIHSYQFQHNEFDCYNINFDIVHLDSKQLGLLMTESQNCFLALSEKDLIWYKQIFIELENNCEHADVYSQIYSTKILEFLISNLLSSNSKNNLSNTNNYHSSPVSAAILYIQKNFRQNIHIKDVAGSVWLSDNYFSNIFHRETGVTFSKYLTDIRLKNACYMLVHGCDSISEISADSGFNNPKHFHRIFKKTFGITPIEYRNGKNQ